MVDSFFWLTKWFVGKVSAKNVAYNYSNLWKGEGGSSSGINPLQLYLLLGKEVRNNITLTYFIPVDQVRVIDYSVNIEQMNTRNKKRRGNQTLPLFLSIPNSGLTSAVHTE